MRVDRRILVEGDTVGYLTIWSETAEITTRLATSAVVAITAFVVATLVLLFVFDRMQPVLMAPLVDLHETIRRIVRTRDYSVRAKRTAADELNDVVVAFNDLLAQIEERDSAPAAAATPATPANATTPSDEMPVRIR
jgi:methyl-accepting chemotaxis protein